MASDVELLADELFRRKYEREQVPESFDQSRLGELRLVAEMVLASDWLTQREATLRSSIAAEIEALRVRHQSYIATFPKDAQALYVGALQDAARIARGGTK